MEDTPPTWLDNSFLGKALRSSENDHSIMVMSSEIERATAAGENYTSDMYRAVVQITRSGKNEKRFVIIKSTKLGLTGVAAKLIEKPTLFFQEIDTFTLVLPEMYRLLDEAAIGPYQPFAAKHIYSNKDNPITIILEDLKQQGFTLPKTTNGLDFKHCLLVIKRIARYHAVSVVMHHKNPSCFKPFLQNIYYGEEANIITLVLGNKLKNCAKEVDSWPDDQSRFAAKLYEFSEKIGDLWFCGLKRDESSNYNVLTHGDLWMNNIMYRYSDDTGEVVDVRFVDFQMSHWTTPAVDLHYFLYSSASMEVLEKVETLIEEYHTTLCKTLCQLGCQSLQPTLEQVNEELDKKGMFAVLCTTGVRSAVLADRSEIADLNKFADQEDKVKLSDSVKTSLKKLLPLYEKKGWI